MNHNVDFALQTSYYWKYNVLSYDNSNQNIHYLTMVNVQERSRSVAVNVFWCGLIDIAVVLPMSTNWMPMLARAGSILSCASMRLGCQVTADCRWFIKLLHHWQVEISPVLSGIDNKPTILKRCSLLVGTYKYLIFSIRHVLYHRSLCCRKSRYNILLCKKGTITPSPKSQTNVHVIENKLTHQLCNWRVSLFSITLVWLFRLDNSNFDNVKYNEDPIENV